MPYTVINNLPNIAMPKPVSSGADFIKQVNETMKLANTGALAYGNIGKQPSISDIENNPNLSQREKSDIITNYHKQILNSIQPQNMISPGETSYKEMEPYINSKDFAKLGYNPKSNNDQRYIDNRTGWNTTSKIFQKFITNAGVGAASLVTPIAGQNLADKLTLWQQNVEERQKIFYTEKEDKENYNPFTTKFYDNLLPSLGFTVGNMAATSALMYVTGGILGGVGGVIANSSKFQKVLNVVKNAKLDSYKKLKNLDDTIAAGLKTTANNIETATFSIKAPEIVKALPYSWYSANAESHIEASTNRRDTYDALIEEYKKLHKKDPSPEETLKMAEIADQVYDKTLSYGTTVLAVTNLFEINALMSNFGMVSRLSGLKGIKYAGKLFDTEDVIFRTGAKEWQKKTWKELAAPYVTSQILNGVAESFEEGSQFAISNGLQSWAKQKYTNPLAENISKPFSEFVLSKDNLNDEFVQNAFFGGLSGMLFGAGSSMINTAKDKISKAPDKAQLKADILNKHKHFFSQKALEANEDKINIYNQNAEALKQALESGDVFSAKNIQFSDFYTWVAASIKAGGFDLRLEQLKDLQNLQGEEFSEFFQMEYNEENKTAIKNYLEKVKKKGKEIAKDIEIFKDIENIYNYHEGDDSTLTPEQKEENENYELFENAKFDLGYYHSRVKNFEKRSSQLLDEFESSFGGTNLMNVIKNIAFSSDVLSDYKNNLKKEIKKLKEDLKGLETPSGIFLEDYKDSLEFINKKQSLLNLLESTKEDYDKYVEENGDKMTQAQKDAFIKMTARSKDLFSIGHILESEIDALDLSGGINFEGKSFHNKEQLLKEVNTIVQDLFIINQNKEIVLDKFNKMNTKKGIHEFVQSLKELKKNFEEGKTTASTQEEEFLKELNALYKQNGYPENSEVVGVNLTFFEDANVLEENAEDLERLNIEKQKAIDSIVELAENKGFVTNFNILNNRVPLTAKTKEDLQKKIENEFEKIKKKKIKKESNRNFIIKREVTNAERDKDGKMITPFKYRLVSENGESLFEQNKLFTPKELKDLLMGVQDLKNTHIRKFELIPYEDFKRINTKVNQIYNARTKLSSLAERMSTVESRIKFLASKAVLSENVEVLNSPLKDVLNNHLLQIINIQNEIIKLEEQKQEIDARILNFRTNYQNNKGSNKGWQFTQQYKDLKKELESIQDSILSLKSDIKTLEGFISKQIEENADLVENYNNLKLILKEYYELVSEKEVLITLRNDLIDNLENIKQNKTTKVKDFSQELKERENALFIGFTDATKEELKNKMDDIISKEKEIIEIHNMYIAQKNLLTNTLKEIEKREKILLKVDFDDTEQDLASVLEEMKFLRIQKNNLKSKIEELNATIEYYEQNINNIGSSFEKDFLEEYKDIQNLTDIFSGVTKALSRRYYIDIDKGLNDSNFKELFSSYKAQRRFSLFGGKPVLMEVDSSNYDYSSARFQPNAVMQSTGRDITTEEDKDGNHIIPSQEEINNNPQIEFYRFLSNTSPDIIRDDYDVMLITPLFLEKNQSNPLFKDILEHIKKQYSNIDDMNPETDIFQVIVDKINKEPLKINGQYLTASFYKPNNKFALNSNDELMNITPKKVLEIFMQSEKYLKEIEGKNEQEIAEYLVLPETLEKAIKYAKNDYSNQLKTLSQNINESTDIFTHSIEDVTTGIFVRGEEKSIAEIENKNNLSIGIVTEENKIKFLDSKNQKKELYTNIGVGNVVMVDTSTNKWFPVNVRKSSKQEVDQILGILEYTIDLALSKNVSIHNICNTEEVEYPNGQFQSFVDENGKNIKGITSIPLFPRFKNSPSSGKLEDTNYFRRWSIMTTYFNFGFDKNNNKNTFYFTHKNDLAYYSPSNRKVNYLKQDKVKELLNAYFENKIEDLSENDKNTLNDLISHIQNKSKNISAQYALNTGNNKVLIPIFDRKKKNFSFKMYPSYLEYVSSSTSSNPRIISTTIEKVDDRITFQQSLILTRDNKLSPEKSFPPTKIYEESKKETTPKTESSSTRTERETVEIDLKEITKLPKTTFTEEENLPKGVLAISISSDLNISLGFSLEKFNSLVINNPYLIILNESDSDVSSKNIFKTTNALIEETLAETNPVLKQFILGQINLNYNRALDIYVQKNLGHKDKKIILTNTLQSKKDIEELGDITLIEFDNKKYKVVKSFSTFNGQMYQFENTEDGSDSKVILGKHLSTLISDGLVKTLSNNKENPIITSETKKEETNSAEKTKEETAPSEIEGVKFSSEEETLAAFGLQYEDKSEQELFDILKNTLGKKLTHSSIDEMKKNDDILYMIDIGMYDSIKDYLISQIKDFTKDSLVELSLNKILENNKNIRKNC